MLDLMLHPSSLLTLNHTQVLQSEQVDGSFRIIFSVTALRNVGWLLPTSVYPRNVSVLILQEAESSLNTEE